MSTDQTSRVVGLVVVGGVLLLIIFWVVVEVSFSYILGEQPVQYVIYLECFSEKMQAWSDVHCDSWQCAHYKVLLPRTNKKKKKYTVLKLLCLLVSIPVCKTWVFVLHLWYEMSHEVGLS